MVKQSKMDESIEEENQTVDTESTTESSKKPPKRGIIYLSTIPPYMDVTRIREYFEEFGSVGRVYLQLSDQHSNPKEKKSKQKSAKKFVEGWIEFERKHIAKKVAQFLTNTRVSDRKKSKQYDHIWNIKYLKNFKWEHLHERLAYEKAARRQKLRTEIQLAKKKTLSFSNNLDKKKKNKQVVNKEYENLIEEVSSKKQEADKSDGTTAENRKDFLATLF